MFSIVAMATQSMSLALSLSGHISSFSIQYISCLSNRCRVCLGSCKITGPMTIHQKRCCCAAHFRCRRCPFGALVASQEGLDDLFFVTPNFVLKQAFASISLLHLLMLG